MEYKCTHTYAYIHAYAYIYILNQSSQLYRFDCCVVFSPDPIHSPRVYQLRLVAISCASRLCSALDWRMRSSPFTWKRCVKAMATTMPINHMPGKQAGRQAAPTRSDPLSFGIGGVDLPRN